MKLKKQDTKLAIESIKLGMDMNGIRSRAKHLLATQSLHRRSKTLDQEEI